MTGATASERLADLEREADELREGTLLAKELAIIVFLAALVVVRSLLLPG